MIFKYEVKNIKSGREIGKIYGDKSWGIYLIRWHPELNIFQNLMINTSLAYIHERDKR